MQKKKNGEKNSELSSHYIQIDPVNVKVWLCYFLDQVVYARQHNGLCAQNLKLDTWVQS